MDPAQQLGQWIAESDNIVFFGGAGVSTESKIPDFRSEDGLYRAEHTYGYPPEVMLSHSFFEARTKDFYKYYLNELIYKDAQPNQAHYALAKLEEMGNALSEREQQLAALQQQYAMEISEEAQVINRKVLQSIMDYLAVYNESHHFHYILGTSFGGMILYSDKSLDITREILDGLNKTYYETVK